MLTREPPSEECARRWREHFVPYHDTLRRLVDEKKARFGHAVLLSAHSFPPPWGGAHIANLVIGTDHGHASDPSHATLIEHAAFECGWTVAIDDPYPGGFATREYGMPEDGVYAVQLELARSLYMDTETLSKASGFLEVARFACEVVKRLGSTDQVKPQVRSPFQ